MSNTTSSRKSPRISKSDSPSSTANNKNGRWVLDDRLRSVLCHPLGLPLACAFHGEDPGKLQYLGQPRSRREPNVGDKILHNSYKFWQDQGGQDEKKLTKILSQRITANKKVPLYAKPEDYVSVPTTDGKGQVDFALYRKVWTGNPRKATKAGRALAFVEVGLNGDNWWQKFDQSLQYVKMNFSSDTTDEPLLLAVMTIDRNSGQSNKAKKDVEVKLGVFLCSRKEEGKDNMRISLLWHTRTRNGSVAFGRLLRGVCDFSSWMEKEDDPHYEYFSTNCCRVGDMVLRSYDSRFRKTTRSSDIYLSDDCKEIVGEETREIWKTKPERDLPDNSDRDEFWNKSETRLLQVIVTPYRVGKHYATKPTSFVPVIAQLDMLHEREYVHGDIRGFNTVFDEDNEKGYLIDFDFGGRTGIAKYPEGYNTALNDGRRLVDMATSSSSQNLIQPWQDWFALGRLIFEVHRFVPPKGAHDTDTLELQKTRLNDAWEDLHDDPTPELIGKLTGFLKEIEKAGWTVKPSSSFMEDLDKVLGSGRPRNNATYPRATGSPPEKK